MSQAKYNFTRWLIFGGVCLLFVAIAVFFYFSLHGTTVTTEQYSDPSVSHTLKCMAKDVVYPFFEYDNAQSKTAEVDVIFNNNDLATVSFVYTMYYKDEKSANDSYNINHISMNKEYGEEFGHDAFNAIYNVVGARMEMRLYAKKADFVQSARKYFMFETNSSDIADIQSSFIKNHFQCTESK